MEGTIWPKLVAGLMGGAPISDAAVTCNGGDGKLDIYLEPKVLGEVLGKTYTVGALGELSGSDQYPINNGDAEVKYTWNLTPQREP